ncbi:SDR family oxidoreductase [Wenjunlia tyrosinilytica]|uniref:Nucleotide-diphosphate-sugar epimerase n=1 Tax=Wenjunlia tyrosinilytica TaxID=1544741 RepID=A0A918DW50_9ACTN|nr:SDR family oxidoreductase [Wenjunlia tyrosinilytica]GGO86159.1 nucleotide-diphosphate-sugar epimerase [Wenjunlia tyrosinilytica]
MAPTTLVTGGTGTLGRPLVRELLDAGSDVRVLSRRPAPDATPFDWRTGDLRDGSGLDGALRGVEAVVHCASGTRGDVDAAANLIAAAKRSGDDPHLVYISIVGVDRIPFGYYRAKLRVEELIGACGMPWTVLRATQFHDLVASAAAALSKVPPVMPVAAGFRFQPIEVEEVAARLAELTLSGVPQGRVPDMGGPQILTTGELARIYLRATGRRRTIVPVPLPGRISQAVRAGANLAPAHSDGKRTFAQFLKGE